MATFVIVHGGWGGGWEWRGVADRLRERGHHAYTPTLTGLGERSHLLSRSITFETHVADVANVVEWERLDDAILVGHSYGGVVVTAAASRVIPRLRALIYVDAFIPRDGEREIDLIDPAWVETYVLGPAKTVGEGWLVPFPFPDDLDDLPPEAADRYRASPHPLATYTDPIAVDPAVAGLPSAYVRCTAKEPGEDAFGAFVALARERGWPVRDVASGHDVQLEDPAAIAQVLHELAAAI